MNWGKIKTTFIYLFLVLNIALLAYYIYTVHENNTVIFQEKEAITKAMKEDNIIFEESTLKKENLGYINVTNYDFSNFKKNDTELEYDEKNISNNYLTVRSENPISNVNNDKYKEELDKFIIDRLKVNEIYVFSDYDKKNKVVVYEQFLEGLRVFDNKNARIKFKVEDSGEIKELEITAVINPIKDKAEVLATQTQVVNKLYLEDLIPKNSKVKAVLGYYTYISQVGNQVLIPTWKIDITNSNGDSRYYVDAINQKILDKTSEEKNNN